MNNEQIGEEEENCINSILEKGIEEIRSSQCGSATNNNINTCSINTFPSQIKTTYNLSTYNNPLTTSNIVNSPPSNRQMENAPKEEEEVQRIRPSNNQRLKDMQMKLDSLQSRINGLDKRLSSSNNISYKMNETPKSSYKSSKSKKKRSYSSNSSNRSLSKKNVKSINDSIWKERYLKLKNDFNEDKTVLIKLRQEKNELNKKLERLSKKEVLYDELFTTNEKIIESNEMLFSQLEESEDVRSEQEKLIISLQKEVQRLRGDFEKADLLKRSTRQKKH